MALGHVQGDLDVSARSVRVSGEVLDPAISAASFPTSRSRSSAESASNAGAVASARRAGLSCQSASPSAAAHVPRYACLRLPEDRHRLAETVPRFGHPVREGGELTGALEESRPFERLVGQSRSVVEARCAS